MDMVIRQAEERDIESMAQLDQLCFAAPWSEKSFQEEIVQNQMAFYIVAEINQQIVGYAGLWRILDEGHITNIAVHPDFRKKGIGESLVMLLMAHTVQEGILSHTLEVRQSNSAAICLYRKLGFKSGGVRKSYYEDNGEDALVMWRFE